MTIDWHSSQPTTTATPFGACDAQDQPFYLVRAGISLEDTLVQISQLLKSAHEAAYELTDSDLPQRGLVWSALHQIETAKGLADALINGLAEHERSAP